MPTTFIIPLANLEYGAKAFQSCLRSFQDPYQTFPTFQIFRLLERGTDLLTDKKYFVWNFLNGSGPKRTTLLGKLETGYRKAVLRVEKPPITSNGTTPSVSRRSRVNSTPSIDPNLSRVSLEVPRRAEVHAQAVSEKAKSKSGKGKKTD